MPPDEPMAYVNGNRMRVYTGNGWTNISIEYKDSANGFWNPISSRAVATPCGRCGKDIEKKPARRFGREYHSHCLARVIREGRLH